MAKIAILTAGFLLSSALAISAAAPARAAADCNSSWGNAACPSPKVLDPHPAPKSRVMPQAHATPPRPVPNKEANNKHPRPHHVTRRAAHRVTHHRSYAEGLRDHRYESRHEYEAYSDTRAAPSQPYFPTRQPDYASSWRDRGTELAAGGYGCDYACEYSNWLGRYNAWYNSYGWYYSAGRGGVAMNRPANRYYGPPDNDHNPSPGYYRRGLPPDQSDRDRLDPWHGYNPHDGLGNGY